MIFFLLGNLCMKIVNSVVVVGLYYGFLTTLSIGPSYLVLLRTLVMEEGEEGTEKKVAATTGFIMGQLMMFISIYYTPLHLALGRPHTITFLALPYLLFNFFWSNHFDYGSTTRNSMRNLSIQCVFLNNLIFQLFNHFVLPSSMLARLVNIYMFRCNNKMLFVTSSFVGWLIGHILFMKCVGLVLVWIRQNFSIRSIIRSNTYLLNVLIRAINVPIRSNKYLNGIIRSKKYKYSVSELKYLVSELKYFVLDLIDSMDRIFSILLFISCVYSLGRMPSPILSRKLQETSQMTERDVEIETTFETKGTKQEQEGFTEEDPSPSLFSEEREDPDKIDETERIRVNGKDKTKDEFHFHLKEEDKDLFWFEKPPVSLLFDYKRWNRPLRYIKNYRFEHAVRNEMSQYFFYTCQSDGKRRISFTYPSSLSAFFEMLRQKMYFSFFTTKKFVCDELDKFFYDELHNYYCWIYTNEKKWRSLRNEFRDRIEALDRGSPYLDVLEKKTRLCNHKTKEEYLPKIYDPLLNGSYRGIIKKFYLPSILNETAVKNSIETNFLNKLNKVHSILLFKGKELNVHNFEELYQKLEGKIATLEEKLVQKLDQKLEEKLEEKLGQKIYTLDQKALARELSLLIDEFAKESTSNWKRISLFPEQRRIDSEDPEKVLKFLIERVIIDPIIQTICDTAIIPPMEKTTRKKSIGINKKVPRWSYRLFSEVEQLGKTATTEEGEEWIVDHQIRSRKAKRMVLFTQGPENAAPTMTKPNELEEVDMIDYPYEADFRRDIITGSMRVQRRKTLTGKMFPLYPYSPLFFDRVGFSWDVLFEPFILSVIEISDLIQDIFRKGIKGSVAKRIKRLKKQKKMYMEENKSYEEIQKEVNEMEKGRDGQTEMERIERTREKIADLYDILIYAHGIRALILLIQSRLRQSIVLPSLILAKNIVRFLLRQEPEWGQDIREMNREVYVICTYNGMPVLKPGRNGIFPPNWATEGIQIMIRFPFRLKPWHRSKIRPSRRDPNPKQESPAAFLTIWGLETDRPFGSPLVGLGILFCYYFGPPLKKLQKAILKWSFRVLKSFKERKKLLFLKVQKEPKKWREDSSEIKKDSIINNQIIHESSIQTRSMDWTNYSLTEIKMKDLTDRTSTIRNQIERITKDKKNGFRTLKINISPNKTSYGAQKLASLKNLFQILKRRNDRLIRKSHYFFKWIVERIYTDILLESFPYIINRLTNSLYRPMIIIKLFRKLKKKSFFDTKEKKIIERISTIQKKLSPSRIRHKIQTKSEVSFKLSLVSQAYVFYKLSQTQVINLYKLGSVLQYDGASLFLKNEIKDYFRRQGIISSELKHKKLQNSGMNQWKNWLKSHYPYDLSELKWSKLVPQKWRNRVNQHCRVENPNLIKRDSSEREEKVSLLLNKNDHFQKLYRYDLLAYQSIYYEDKKDSYNYNIHKPKFVDMGGSIPITNFIRKDYFMYIKNPDRKFCDTKGLFYLKINKDKEINPSKGFFSFFDWMGMSEERLNRPVSKPIPWLFPQFELFFNVYKMKPGFIPIHSLIFHFNEDVSEDVSQNKNLTKNQPQSIWTWEIDLDAFMKGSFALQLKWLLSPLTIELFDYALSVLEWEKESRMTTKFGFGFIKKEEFTLDPMLIRDLNLSKILKEGIFIIEPVRIPVKHNVELIMYQTIRISLVHEIKQKNNQKRYRENMDKNHFEESIARHQMMTKNRNKNHYDLLVPENIFSSRRRRELRILSCFNSRNSNCVDKNAVFCNGNKVKTCGQFLDESKDLDREKMKLMKFFLWPNYRLEDLACMNRYWFDTNNGSRFSMLRIHMYPRLKID
uniref:Ycf1 protein n=1 Tax=Calligonum bakuense TaxID=2785155 RepID=A0A8T9JE74_9CARY|nr:Ycf1 protein [Calligonum bakuense]YP_010350238.1 Ycf1 protein [Calligonum bakuense]UOK09476.1 Ycf1 protein [Calligonum bakuense]UOK09488.1 Ycf1 protein [Calligonum bakuense]UOK09562.1 Ycf1 protein [Calligonum bakuense]UOK09574.1 Ycf1 protein [Calligonum bakuense]